MYYVSSLSAGHTEVGGVKPEANREKGQDVRYNDVRAKRAYHGQKSILPQPKERTIEVPAGDITEMNSQAIIAFLVLHEKEKDGRVPPHDTLLVLAEHAYKPRGVIVHILSEYYAVE